MQRIILPSILILGFLIIGFASFQDAYAAPNCASAVLEANTLYIGTQSGHLYKLQASDGSTCQVGAIKRDTSGLEAPATPPASQTNIKCKDLAIHHPTGVLYCLANGNQLRTVDRLPDGSGFIDTDFVGFLSDDKGTPGDTSDDTFFNDANSLEIDSQGRAYMAGAGNNKNKLFTLDLTTGEARERTDFGSTIISSGDLSRDETTTNHLYMTVLCSALLPSADRCLGPNGVDDSPAIGDDNINDRLYRVLLNTPGCIGPCADTLVPLAELSKGNVFAMDIAQATLNLCMLNVDGFFFETDRDGNQIKAPMDLSLVDALVKGFGATGNNIGGSMIMLNTMALLIAAGQTNAAWLILLAISGVAVVSYQFKDKIKSKSKKINE